MKIIGRVRLASGEVAFYDETSRVHLTISSPEADIYEHTNTSSIKRAIKFRRLVLISGTLSKDNEIAQVKKHGEVNKEIFVEKPAVKNISTPAIAEEKVVEEVVIKIAEEPIKEEVVEEIIEEAVAEEEVIVEEVAPKKAKTKSKSKAKAKK